MKTVAEIMLDLVDRLEEANDLRGEGVPGMRDLLKDCLDFVRWFSQPYPPSKHSRAEFLELRDAMHEGLAVDGEFGGIHRLVPRNPKRGSVAPAAYEENKMALMILDALTVAGIESAQRNGIIEEIAKKLEKNCAEQDTRNEVVFAIRAMKTPAAAGVEPGLPGKEGD